MAFITGVMWYKCKIHTPSTEEISHGRGGGGTLGGMPFNSLFSNFHSGRGFGNFLEQPINQLEFFYIIFWLLNSYPANLDKYTNILRVVKSRQTLIFIVKRHIHFKFQDFNFLRLDEHVHGYIFLCTTHYWRRF